MSVAADFVLVVFGNAWQSTIPFFQWLAIFGIFAGLGRPLMPLFYALRRERLYAILCASQVVVTVPVLIIAAHTPSLVNVAAGRTIVAAIFFVIYCQAAAAISSVRLSDVLLALWRPAAASIAMAAVIIALRDKSLPGHILPLIHDIGIGVITFGVCQGGLWFMAGRPRGPESMVGDRLARLFRH
jgi:O-antigen/teichoic acid export membrane protein